MSAPARNWNPNKDCAVLQFCRIIIGWILSVFSLRKFMCACGVLAYQTSHFVARGSNLFIIKWPVMQWPLCYDFICKMFFPPQNSIPCLFRKHNLVLCHNYSHNIIVAVAIKLSPALRTQPKAWGKRLFPSTHPSNNPFSSR